MGKTHFSGPIKAGPIQYTTGTTLGTNVADVGFVVMAQSVAFTQSATAAVTTLVLPAGSQILTVTALKTTALDGVAQTVSLGTSATATEIAALTSLGTTLGQTSFVPGDDASRVGVWKDVGTTDVAVWTKSANDGAGVGILTVTYLQAADLTP